MTGTDEVPTSEQAVASRRWERLDWDSQFFGFEIGSVDLGGMDRASLEAVDREAAAAGIACLYGRLDASESEVSLLAQELGYRFVEAGTMFTVPRVDPPPSRPEGVEVRRGRPEDRDGLLPLALELAAWSRYAVDPRFGIEAARRLQVAWLDRSLDAGQENHSLLLAEEGGEPVAFVGFRHQPDLHVDAIGTVRRGVGSAQYMVECCREIAAAENRPLTGGAIAARNVTAMRFCMNSGIRPNSMAYTFHRWLDE